MALKGNLQDMAVADLIQHNCQDRKTAHLVIENNGDQASLYFNEGKVVHAILNDLKGEDVVYQILSWENGTFNLEMGAEPPAVTIRRSWSALLLEGARRLDEGKISLPLKKEVQPMATKKKSEQIADVLAGLLEGSADIEGAAIVGIDGLVYSANVPQKALDVNMVGASSAAILGLSSRSVEQLKRGKFNQTLIQGDGGNIIVTKLNANTVFVGLTPKNINLGMAFAESRAMIEQLVGIV
jgi:predicted regulator of Ras-like GTPase activity (Roadblock/LC7/MglB family)